MADEIKKLPNIKIKMTEGGKGQFDVIKDGQVLFSKHQVGRFPETGEISGLLSH